MNYPVWDVAFGAGLLIAIVAITHVFVSHFAIGGGLFLVLTEKKAYREDDASLLDWLKRHTKFFVLVTVVFGAISGVGIWFTIGLIHPSGTSALIHAYVWGWAIEWIFFFLEITAALLYLYGWNKLDRKTHLWLGWIYFIAAYLSMVVINGILAFMLTPGKWLETQNFWQGFFNPTYFPSLLLRTTFAFALAGVYALITGTLQKDLELKGKIVKWSAKWIIPAFIIIPIFAWWYIGNIPDVVWESARGKMPTATQYANSILIFSALTFLFSLLTLIKPKKVPFALSVLIFLLAFGTMGSFEFIREAIRKPYIIYDYMYANSIYKDQFPGDGGMSIQNIQQKGLLPVAKWAESKEITSENQMAAGMEIFRIQCQSCHTIDGYRGIRKVLVEKKWSQTAISRRISSLENMFNAVMPPFAGTDEERETLAAYLTTLAPVAPEDVEVTDIDISGEVVFEANCADCHEYAASDTMFVSMGKYDFSEVSYLITRLDSLSEEMPPFEGSDAEREALARWIPVQFK